MSNADETVELAVPPHHPRRVAFLGTPEDAVPTLRSLVDAGFDVALVITAPDRRRGRGRSVSPTPVGGAAAELGLPVAHHLDALADVEAPVDLGVVVAYGQIVPRSVLERVPMVNLHFSLLPRWRGAAPVERAILAGDEVTGVCVMAVEEGLDTGDVYARAELPLGDDDDAVSVRSELATLGARLMVETLSAGLEAPKTSGWHPQLRAQAHRGGLLGATGALRRSRDCSHRADRQRLDGVPRRPIEALASRGRTADPESTAGARGT